ncbi:MAG: sugar phosphate isomerase/epimerase [Fibrobacteres bacterium]|nr:sugar phosphate isomerase/epimerase [Fibrobacterota bacterium]
MASVALQLYTLRDFLKTENDIESTLEKVAQIGYKAVEVAGLGPIESQKLRSILDKNGLKCISMHIGCNDLENDIEAVFAKMDILGIKVAAIGALPKEGRSAEGYALYIPKLIAWADMFKARGYRLAYHNHRFEFEKYNGVLAMDLLANKVPNLYFELDLYWVTAGGGDPVAWIEKFQGRINEIHFKDCTVREDVAIMAEVGEGNLNWPAIINTCKKTGIEWCVVEQDRCERSPIDCVATSFANLKKMGLC